MTLTHPGIIYSYLTTAMCVQQMKSKFRKGGRGEELAATAMSLSFFRLDRYT